MARDDADANSDVDLLVDVPPGAYAFVLGAMLMDALDLLGRRVDIVTWSALNPPSVNGCFVKRNACNPPGLRQKLRKVGVQECCRREAEGLDPGAMGADDSNIEGLAVIA
jgi:hypothetical protein